VNLQVVCTIGCFNFGEYTVMLPGAFGPYEKNNNNDCKQLFEIGLFAKRFNRFFSMLIFFATVVILCTSGEIK